MIIRITAERTLQVEDAQNFRKFKVAVDLPDSRYQDAARANPAAVRFDDPKTAWVSIAALRAFDGLKEDQAWQDGLSAMIKAAEPHGWISPDKAAIKAHVEWAA